MTTTQITEAVRRKYGLTKRSAPPKWWLFHFREITPPQRMVIVLMRFGMAMKQKDIAYVIGIKEPSVTTAIDQVRSDYQRYSGYRAQLDDVLLRLYRSESERAAFIGRMQSNDVGEMNDYAKRLNNQDSIK